MRVWVERKMCAHKISSITSFTELNAENKENEKKKN